MDELKAWLRAHGCLADNLVLDGRKKNRFPLTRPNKLDGWCVGGITFIGLREVASCTLGDHYTGEAFYFRTGGFKNETELSQYKAHIKARNEEAEKEKLETQKHSAIKAKNLLRNSKPCAIGHPYLRKKQIDNERISRAIKQTGELLLLGLQDIDGNVWSTQTIAADGTKMFQSGGRKKGCFFRLGTEDVDHEKYRKPHCLYITEGFATGASIFLAGFEPVYIALDAGNLGPVSHALKDRYPAADIIIAGDDDCWGKESDRNPGREAATRTASECEGTGIFPRFIIHEGKQPTDWNDLHCLEGLDEVKKQIENALHERAISGSDVRCILGGEEKWVSESSAASEPSQFQTDESSGDNRRPGECTSAESEGINEKASSSAQELKEINETPKAGEANNQKTKEESEEINGTGKRDGAKVDDEKNVERAREHVIAERAGALPESIHNTSGSPSGSKGSAGADNSADRGMPGTSKRAESSNERAAGNEGSLPSTEAKSKKISQEEIETLGREILDCRFKLFVDNQTTILYNITNIEKKELVICTNEDILLRRLKQNVLEKIGRHLNDREIRNFYSSWKLATDVMKVQPASFTWADEDLWSFRRLDFVPSAGDFPAWNEFLRRLSSPEDFQAFIWSVFEMKNTSRQILYLHDPRGETGKSTVIKVLGWVFGNSFSAINNTMITGGGSRWLLGQIYGKRLIAWADCKNPKFCMTETARNISSGDPVPIEFKGEPPFQATMYAKLILGSNHEPQITSGGADTSRLMVIGVEENIHKKDDPDWIERLRAELPYFLDSCRQQYIAKCPNHGKIILSEETMHRVGEASSAFEERWDDIIHRRITLGEKYETQVSDWMQLCRDEKLDNNQIGNFKDYLKRRDGVKIGRWRGDGSLKMRYKGFHIKASGISSGGT